MIVLSTNLSRDALVCSAHKLRYKLSRLLEIPWGKQERVITLQEGRPESSQFFKPDILERQV